MLPMLPLGDARKSSKYRGVSWEKQNQKWKAYIYLDGKFFTLGLHATELAAAQAYDKEARKYAGKQLNFRKPDAVPFPYFCY